MYLRVNIANYLKDVKTLILSSPEFIDCEVDWYIEPSISSIVFGKDNLYHTTQ